MTENIQQEQPATIAPIGTPAVPQQEARPDWLPENFKSPQDLVKSYKELQAEFSRSRGGVQQQAPKESIGESNQPSMPPPKSPEAAASAVQASGLDYNAYADEFASTGRLSDRTYSSLEAAGIPRNMVDAYIEGQQAVADKIRSTVFADVGGEDKFQGMIQWAATNWNPEQIKAFNSVVEGGTQAQIQLAVYGLKNAYTAANGSAPRYINQGGTHQSNSDIFRSTAELMQAMKDPRYKKDPAYRSDVEAKLGRSNIL